MTVLLRVGHALRESLAEGYRGRDLRADLGAGVVVGIVAVPLSIALAIASGVAPERGLWTAIVAGGLTALLGGSRVQVSGPTAAFVVILAPIAGRFGVEGLAIATVLAGLMLVAMGLFRLGRLVAFIPYPVTTGFTAGIGVVIATMQVQPFLGLSLQPLAPDAGTAARLAALVHALPSARPSDVVAGATTLALLLVWRRVRSRVPAPLVALVAGALVAWALERFLPGTDVVTLADRFGTSTVPAGIPRQAPSFALPWSLPGPAGAGAVPLSLELVRELLPPAFAIAVLGAIESLHSAVIADGMSGRRHDPDVELLALGVANVCSPFFGGIPATGAIARTATNVRSGGRTPRRRGRAAAGRLYRAGRRPADRAGIARLPGPVSPRLHDPLSLCVHGRVAGDAPRQGRPQRPAAAGRGRAGRDWRHCATHAAGNPAA
jgi:SulP family sulfate permease